MVHFSDIIETVRELSFDRFIIPGVVIKALPDKTVTINSQYFWIKNQDNTDYYKADLSVLTTFKLLTDDMLSKNVVFAYTSYFNGFELTSTFVPVLDASLAVNFIAYKRFFFSDETIQKEVIYYYYSVLGINIVDENGDGLLLGDIDNWIVQLIYPSEQHLAMKVAYMLVDKRRLYEVAADYMNLNFTDGSLYMAGSKDGTENSTETTVQIGSVFSITEDPNNGDLYEDYSVLGSDNVLGDKHSFWYRLLLYLREKLEMQFGDYSLRKDTVIVSDSQYIDNMVFREYFESYPFTLSPLVRNIIQYN